MPFSRVDISTERARDVNFEDVIVVIVIVIDIVIVIVIDIVVVIVVVPDDNDFVKISNRSIKGSR